VHSQFDTVERLPTISIILVLELALLFALDEPCPNRQKTRHWVLPLGWAMMLAVALWSLYATGPFSRGVAAANAGRWEKAVSLLDAATQRDPHFAYYHLQVGYAHGVLAQDQPDHLDEAIVHYRAGIARSPNYALNAANFSVLLWQAGEPDQALDWMERAVDQAPRSALFHLNLGRFYEQLAREKPARRHYEVVLDRAPNWVDAYFWRANPFRAAVKRDWIAARPDPRPVSTPTTLSQWLRAGRRAVADGRPDDARRAFQRVLSFTPHGPRAYVGQATAATALGLDDEAEKLLHTALLTQGSGEFDRLRARFALARLYYRQARVDDAVRLAEETVARVRDPCALIPDQLGGIEYAWYLFHSERIDASLLPQLTVITVTDEVADWMLQLAAWHEQAGDPAAAAAVYRQLLQHVPDSQTARQRLADLEP
jgi:tetratricopeptide (TPR) repeat protein